MCFWSFSCTTVVALSHFPLMLTEWSPSQKAPLLFLCLLFFVTHWVPLGLLTRAWDAVTAVQTTFSCYTAEENGTPPLCNHELPIAPHGRVHHEHFSLPCWSVDGPILFTSCMTAAGINQFMGVMAMSHPGDSVSILHLLSSSHPIHLC